MGQTDKTDDEIMAIGKDSCLLTAFSTPSNRCLFASTAQRLISRYTIYNLATSNCQTFATKFLSEVCDVEIIANSALETQLRKVSPELDALYMVNYYYREIIQNIGEGFASNIMRLRDEFMKDDL